MTTLLDRGAVVALETTRFHLRPIAESDVHDMFAMWSEPGHMRFFARAAPESIEAARTNLERMLAQVPVGESKGWTIRGTSDERFLGVVGIIRIDWGNLHASLAYELPLAARGQGVAREAAERAIRFAFEELGLHRVQVEIDVDNLASIRVAEALGFAREGTLRGVALIGGEFRDEVILAKLNPAHVAPA